MPRRSRSLASSAVNSSKSVPIVPPASEMIITVEDRPFTCLVLHWRLKIGAMSPRDDARVTSCSIPISSGCLYRQSSISGNILSRVRLGSFPADGADFHAHILQRRYAPARTRRAMLKATGDRRPARRGDGGEQPGAGPGSTNRRKGHTVDAETSASDHMMQRPGQIVPDVSGSLPLLVVAVQVMPYLRQICNPAEVRRWRAAVRRNSRMPAPAAIDYCRLGSP